jgi:prepilin-type N-terminal cleavage/methylation domain-containing protein
MNASLPPIASSRNRAFTLIELLVVIAIIASLAGMTMGAASGVINQGKKVSARNDMMNIVTAIKSYNTDYGHYPIDSQDGGNDDLVYGNHSTGAAKPNSEIINVLRYGTDTGWADNATSPLNPRQTRYLELTRAKDPNNPRSGLDDRGNWYDPWGEQYIVFIDGEYNNDINVKPVFTSGIGTANNPGKVSITVGAASVGYDTKVKKRALPGSFNPSNDLVSWR